MSRDRLVRAASALPHPIRWIVVGTVGGVLVLAGLILMVLPGPGIPLLLLGLVVLASEFAWAEVILGKVKAGGSAAWARVRRR